MISGGLPGEEVLAEKIRERAGVIEARCMEVSANAHPDRELHPCPHAPLCGGCDWPHVEAEKGVGLKRESAADAARAFPELRERLLDAPILPSPSAYRLRARLHWDPQQKILGFYEALSRIISPISACRILSPRLMATIPLLERALGKTCPKAVDVEWLEDLEGLKAIAALRKSAGGREIRAHWVPSKERMEKSIEGFHILRKSNRLEAGWGINSLRMNLPIPLDVRIGAFFQGNRHLVSGLFERVAEICGPEPLPTWDLHAGVGFLAAAALSCSERPLTLCEPVRASARAARSNLQSARVFVGMKAEELLRRERGKEKRSLVLCDPPRSGLSPELRKKLKKWRPEKIVMLSCDPATWARDTADLLGSHFRLEELELIDLFPSTHHVEILCSLVPGERDSATS